MCLYWKSKIYMKGQNHVSLRNRIFCLKWEHFQNYHDNHSFVCNKWIYLHKKTRYIYKKDRAEAADLYVMNQKELPKYCPHRCWTYQILLYTCQCIFKHSIPGPNQCDVLNHCSCSLGFWVLYIDERAKPWFWPSQGLNSGLSTSKGELLNSPEPAFLSLKWGYYYFFFFSKL